MLFKEIIAVYIQNKKSNKYKIQITDFYSRVFSAWAEPLARNQVTRAQRLRLQKLNTTARGASDRDSYKRFYRQTTDGANWMKPKVRSLQSRIARM